MLATTPKKSDERLSSLLQLYAETAAQAVNALQSRRHAAIATGLLPRLEETISGIEAVIEQGAHTRPASVTFEAKQLIADLRSKGQAFAAAIETRSLTEAKTVAGWLGDLCCQIGDLLRVE